MAMDDQQVLEEARRLVNGDDIPVWPVAAALALGYTGEGVVLHVAQIVLKWHDLYAVKSDRIDR